MTRSAARPTDGPVVLDFGRMRLRPGDPIRVGAPVTLDQLRLR